MRREPPSRLRAQLVAALIDIPLMGTVTDRRTLIRLIRSGVVNFPDVQERSETRPHVLDIVLACLHHPGALPALRNALELMAPEQQPTVRACQLIDSATLLDVLDAGELNRVHGMLRQVMAAGPEDDWWRRPPGEFGVRVPESAADLVDAFDRLAAEETGDDRVPPALRLIRFVARRAGEPLSGALIEWAAGRLEIEESQRLFQVPGGQARDDGLPRLTGVLALDDNIGAMPPGATGIGIIKSSQIPTNLQDAEDFPRGAEGPENPLTSLVPAADEPEPGSGESSERGEEMTPVATTKKARLPRVWGDVPPRNPNFTGRDELLDRLHDELQAVSRTAVLPKALHGMGGVGKSQIAIEYVHRHRDRYDLVWWVPAQLDSQIKASLAQLAQRLELNVPDEANAAVSAIREALSTGTVDYDNWLLIFDNAESPEQVQEYFPTGGSGRILVTSRDSNWSFVTRTVEVDVFTRDESVEYLTTQDPDLSRTDADRLARALGDLPLAVEQVAAWRAATRMPVDEYLELLEEKAVQLLDAVSSPHYRRTVAAAWKVSIDKLRNDNEAAYQLLQLCSFFAPEPIPRSLLAGAPTTSITDRLDSTLSDRFLLNRAFLDVQRSALTRVVDVREPGRDTQTQALNMHRLVQFVLRAQMSAEEQEVFRRGAHILLANANPRNPSRRDHWEGYLRLRPHVEVSRAVESRDPRVQEFVSGMVRFLFYWGDHTGAEALAEEAYGYWVEFPGEEDPQTLRLAKWLGHLRRTNGRFEAAREINERTLAVYQRTAGERNEGTIDAMVMVAADLRTAGEFAAARDLDQRALDLAREEFGADYEATLNCAHSLGVSLRLTGEFARAAELDRDTYGQRLRRFGADNIETLNTRNAVLIDMRESGLYLEAARQQEELYLQHVRAFGENAPATLRAARTLAVARRKAGHHDTARALAHDTYDRYRRRYGDDYPHTIAAAMALAVDLRHSGDLRAARALGEDNLTRYRKLFGTRHAYTLSARTNLAITLRLSGQPDDARRHNAEALELLESTLGRNHVVTLICATNLASDLFASGEVQHAYERDSDTLARSERVLGVEHPSTLASSLNLSLDLQQLGRTGESEKILADTLQRYKHVLGPKHPAVLNARESIRADCDVDPMGF